VKRLTILLASVLIVLVVIGAIGCSKHEEIILSPTTTLTQTPALTPVVTPLPKDTATLTPKPTHNPTFTPVNTPVLSPPPTLTPTPGSCCYDNFDCDFTEYCAKTVNNCSGCGSCQPRPDTCTQVYNPVCGCDGNTYTNAGCAAAAGVNIMFAGECRFWIPLPLGVMWGNDYTMMRSLIDCGKTP
jgi:hypothetical protein